LYAFLKAIGALCLRAVRQSVCPEEYKLRLQAPAAD